MQSLSRFQWHFLEIYSRNTVAITGASCLPPKVSLEMQEWRPVDCYQGNLLLSELGGAVSGSYLGGVSRSHQAIADGDLVLAMWGKGSTEARWRSPAGYAGGGPN